MAVAWDSTQVERRVEKLSKYRDLCALRRHLSASKLAGWTHVGSAVSHRPVRTASLQPKWWGVNPKITFMTGLKYSPDVETEGRWKSRKKALVHQTSGTWVHRWWLVRLEKRFCVFACLVCLCYKNKKLTLVPLILDSWKEVNSSAIKDKTGGKFQCPYFNYH